VGVVVEQLSITEFDLDQPVTVWDVRDAAAYAEGHVQGALHRPLDQITPAQVAAVPADQPIYVLCGGGTKAGRAAALIASFEPARRVVELTGGTRAAKAAGMAIEFGV